MLKALCPACPWGRDMREPREMDRLMRVSALLDSGCPVGRHELRDGEWLWLGALRLERLRIERERKIPDG